MADLFTMQIGKTLKEAREAKGLSQGALAEAAGLHRTYVNMLEHDKKSPTLEVFFRLCSALGTSPSKLMGRIERENQPLK